MASEIKSRRGGQDHNAQMGLGDVFSWLLPAQARPSLGTGSQDPEGRLWELAPSARRRLGGKPPVAPAGGSVRVRGVPLPRSAPWPPGPRCPAQRPACRCWTSTSWSAVQTAVTDPRHHFLHRIKMFPASLLACTRDAINVCPFMSFPHPSFVYIFSKRGREGNIDWGPNQQPGTCPDRESN